MTKKEEKEKILPRNQQYKSQIDLDPAAIPSAGRGKAAKT